MLNCVKRSCTNRNIIYFIPGLNESESTEFIWNYQSIKLLLSIRFEMDKQFSKPQKKKK